MGLAKIEKVTNEELVIRLVSAPIWSVDRTSVTLTFGIGGVGNEVIVFSKTLVQPFLSGSMQEVVNQELAAIKNKLIQLGSSH